MTRRRIEPTDDWRQIELLSQFLEQRSYERLRPVVLFGQPTTERARETQIPQRTLYRQVYRFDQEGMASLFPPPKVDKHNQLPAEIREEILKLKAEHPAFRPNEIATICYVRFNRRPSPHTVKRILAENPVMVGAQESSRRFPPYHQTQDAVEPRRAVITLHAEGWNVASIARYLMTSRETVHRVLRRWVEEGVEGLEDKSSAPHNNVRKADLRAVTEIKRLQQNPRLGAFRVHAALERMGIYLSRATCGRIMARNRKLYGLPKPEPEPEPEPREPKIMPFAASRRFEYWSVDIRYVGNDKLGYQVYCISILENFSRLVLASMLSRTQTSADFLKVLYSAIRQYGAPEQLVSDGGGQFRSNEAKRIHKELGITKREIERRQPWMNYLEANFGVQKRMADWRFAEATSWEELNRVHDEWVTDFNYQPHFAHRKRDDGRRSPAQVLGWVCGRQFPLGQLDKVFRSARFKRMLDGLGYARFRHWRLYGEEGLSDRQAAIWLSEDTLAIEYEDETLAVYKVRYQPDQKHMLEITEPRIFPTPYRSMQLHLWKLDDDEWLKMVRLPEYRPHRRYASTYVQSVLIPDHMDAPAV